MNTKISFKILNHTTTIFISLFLVTTYAHAKDDVSFDCEIIGHGYQSPDKSGSWRNELGSFQWRYNSSMIEAKPFIKLKDGNYGCEPVRVESPKIFLDEKKYIYISASICGIDSPSYFYSITNLSDIEVRHYLGYSNDIIKDEFIRIILESSTNNKLAIKNKIFESIYFDCNIQ